MSIKPLTSISCSFRRPSKFQVPVSDCMSSVHPLWKQEAMVMHTMYPSFCESYNSNQVMRQLGIHPESIAMLQLCDGQVITSEWTILVQRSPSKLKFIDTVSLLYKSKLLQNILALKMNPSCSCLYIECI